MPFANVGIWKLFCRDRETIVGKDHLGLAGAVIVDGKAHTFVQPAWTVTRNQSLSYHATPFSGYSESLRVGLVLRAWDIDNNDRWAMYRNDVSKTSDALAEAVGHLPVVGDVASFILEHWPKVVDIFVDLDDDDELLKWAGYLDLPFTPTSGATSEEYELRFSRRDPTGFSSWDYSIFIIITASNPLSFTRDPAPRRSLAPKTGTRREDWGGRWESLSCTVTIAESPDDFTLMKVNIKSRNGNFPNTEEYTYISPAERINTVVLPPQVAPLEREQALLLSMGHLGSVTLEQDKTNWTTAIPDPTKPKSSGGDVLFLQEGGMLEMFDVLLNGGASNVSQIRYLRPATRDTVALPLDEMLQKVVV